MMWSKTDAGRAEMQTRSLVKERVQRNLLLLIDGTKSESTLMAAIAGVTMVDLTALADLGLIAPVPGSGSSLRDAAASAAAPAAAPARAAGDPQDYGTFTATLTQLISQELGLRGFTLSLAVEKAGTYAELQEVADRVLKQILDRKGPETAAKARSALYGG